ncbi:MAG: MFS transporter, partial [Rhodospirillales bacterium]
GSVLFAMAESFMGLFVGRALIGLGVAACLMASFKAYVMWFPKDRLPFVNGCQMAAGGLGALGATVPIEMLLSITDWRGIFFGLAALTVVSALFVLLAVPEKRKNATGETLRRQCEDFLRVLKSPPFLRLAPLTVTVQSTFISVQSLWSGPWLYDIAGLGRGAVAEYLFAIAAGMVAGFLTLGTAAANLGRFGIKPIAVMLSGVIVFMAVQGLIVLQWREAILIQWIAFGFFGTTSILSYAILSQAFPSDLAGRVNAGLNLLLFSAIFFVQWGIGAVIDLWPATQEGRYAPAGYQASFGMMLGLQCAALGWFCLYRRARFDIAPS